MTRFIALASVGNPAKAKSLHALALTPAADMDIAVLTQRPDGTTPCPYELPKSSKRALNGQDEDAGGQARLCQAVSHALPAYQDLALRPCHTCITAMSTRFWVDPPSTRVPMSVWPVDAKAARVMAVIGSIIAGLAVAAE